MSKKPPVPEQNQSPFPIEEAPHDHEPQGEAIAVAKAMREAKARRAPNNREFGLGAAVGIGSAAIIAGLLYWRGGRKDGK